MKYNYLRYGVLALLAAVGTVSCSDDDTMIKPEPSPVVNPALPEHPELTLSSKSLDLLVDETKSIEILDGAGDYKLSVLDASYAEATLTGSTIQLKGLKYGNTDLVISDQGGSYTTVTVNVYKSDKLTTSVAEGSMVLTLAMGQPVNGQFTITAGNDPYTVESSDPQTVSATLGSDGVTVNLVGQKGQEEGAAPVVITVKDARGLETKVSITTEVSDSPFTDAQLEQIKAISTATYVINGKQIPEDKIYQKAFAYSSMGQEHWGCYAMSKSSNMRTYCLYYLSAAPSTVDMKTTGIKEGLTLCYTEPEGNSGFDWILQYKPVIVADKSTVEVIKAENNMSWVTFYCYGDDETLYIGYMVMPWD